MLQAIRFAAFVVATLVALMASVLSPCTSDARTSGALNSRQYSPVILTGADVPSLGGQAPSSIVAFRYDAGWVRIPVQVDERDSVDFGTIYNMAPSGFLVLTYTDTSTFTGPDSDPLLDADDEIVFMAVQTGGLAPGVAEPAGVVSGSGVQVAVLDAATADDGYVYLFVNNGSLPDSVAPNPAAYSFVLASGPYKTTYSTNPGPNPEDSDVVTAHYRVHFADRWIRDETAVFAGGATGVDIVDRHKNLFSPGNCARSEDTFSAGEGAFIVNREGPVRTLRGYVGANSGPTTHRIHAFYGAREDIITVLRVHAIGGIVDFFDYADSASSMTFHNDLNLAGVMIDGSPDVVVPGPFTWEMVTGAQGTMVFAHTLDTDVTPFDYSSYYEDDTSPSVTQCTGDNFAYGSSGFWEQDPIPNTDPALGSFNTFVATRRIAYAGPGQTTAFATATAGELTSALQITTSPYLPTVSVGHPGATSKLSLAVAPNPVGGLLRIDFALPHAVSARLDLFDVRGRRVADVANRAWPDGPHSLIWDGARLPAGVYFVRLSNGNGLAKTARFVKVD